MSNSPDTGLDLEDLELQLLPAWARQSPDSNRYAKYEGGEAGPSPHGRERRGKGPDRRQRDEAGTDRQRKPRDERAGPPRRAGGGRFDGPRREEKREPVQPLPEISVDFVPEDKGVESLARQIKLTGRSYPIFDIAHLILKRPDRYHVTFTAVKKPDGAVAQQLWACSLDDTLWLSGEDAAHHILRKHFDTFYKAERAPADPPKGTYTFVAQCGLSGVILGPPNYHDYQNKLRKLHAERFSRMPFEVYKSKVKIVKDETVVKKWVEEQSWRTEYSCLNVPEAKKLGSRDEVDRHFREVHFGNIIRPVESHTLLGAAAQQLPTPALRQLLRRAWDDQQRFPIKIVTTLSQQFAAHGLQFFKVNKSITHVAVARPHYLDLEATPVSEGIKRIVDFIGAHCGCTRRQLIEALAPPPAPAVAPTTPPAADGTVTTGRPVAASATPLTEMLEPNPEQTAIIADLHWLIHQGHMLEFANGRIETAKKPAPKPPRPEAKPAKAGAEPTVSREEGPPGLQPIADIESASQTKAPSGGPPVTQETAQPPATPEGTAGSPGVGSHAETVSAPSGPVPRAEPATIQVGSA